MTKLLAAPSDEIDPIGTELSHAILRNIFRQVINRSVVKTHLFVDVLEIPLYRCSDDAEVPYDPSRLVLLKPLEDFYFGRLMLIFKYSPWHTD